MRMSLQQTTPPYGEPVSLAEAKLHVRQDEPDDDATILRMIRSARRKVEEDTGRQLCCATWQMILDRFPLTWDGGVNYGGTGGPGGEPYRPDWNGMVLPRPPLVGVNAITYVDPSGVTQTWSPTLYLVDAVSEPARVTPAYGQIYPVPRIQIGAVQVQYTSGYAAPFTANSSTGFITVQGRTITNGQVFRLQNSGGALPTGLLIDTDYYVIGQSGQTCQLSLTSGGSAVSFTDNGTGTQLLGEIPEGLKDAILLLVGNRYEYREAAGQAMECIPYGYDDLIWQGNHGHQWSLN